MELRQYSTAYLSLRLVGIDWLKMRNPISSMRMNTLRFG
jgi:hypothetical protein